MKEKIEIEFHYWFPWSFHEEYKIQSDELYKRLKKGNLMGNVKIRSFISPSKDIHEMTSENAISFTISDEVKFPKFVSLFKIINTLTNDLFEKSNLSITINVFSGNKKKEKIKIDTCNGFEYLDEVFKISFDSSKSQNVKARKSFLIEIEDETADAVQPIKTA